MERLFYLIIFCSFYGLSQESVTAELKETSNIKVEQIFGIDTFGTLYYSDQSASFYKKIIDQKTETSIQLQLRLQMLKTCFFASLPSFLVLFVVLFLYLNFKGLDITNYFLLLPVILSVTILSFFRIWISREIVLTENLIASPLSYILSFIFTITSLYVFSNHGMWIVVSLLVYFLSSCTAPFLINRTRMKFTRLTIKRLFNA